MTDIVILHFGPLEIYPPVQNTLQYLTKRVERNRILVATTKSNIKVLEIFKSTSANIRIKRWGFSGQRLSKFRRYWAYLSFNTFSFFYLLIKRPDTVLYFETISSYPAYLYKRFINSKARIFIHYHEYTSPEEYKTGMKLTRFFFEREKWLIQRADWVSHTNQFRMQRFVDDILPIELKNPQVIPNYPPSNWKSKIVQNINLPVKIVYVGALSIETTYLKEFTSWVLRQKGQARFDIFTFNITDSAKEFLSKINSDWISLNDGVNYSELPNLLCNYDVGVILYKGHILNYVYNAPNKLFEYLTCGLDVWFPDLMKGSLPFVTAERLPKIMAIDFAALTEFDLFAAIDRNRLEYIPTHFFCEGALKEITNLLLKND